jgi:uncharacterized OB-fold protein
MASGLSGKQCERCGAYAVGDAAYCPAGCGATMQDVAFDATGTVYASTTVHVSTPNFEAPYRLGYVDLDNGLRLLGHFEGAPAVAPGQRVHVEERPQPQDRTGPYVRFAFAPVQEHATTGARQ